jgi:hypothetical protein
MNSLAEKHYTGIVQLMSGGGLSLLNAVQCIGVHSGLVLPPLLQKPIRPDDICQAIVSAGLATAVTETVRAGGPTVKAERVRITDAGRKALG